MDRRGSLQGHSINHDFHGQESSIRGHAVSESRLAVSINTVFVNQVPQDLIEDRSPRRTNSVDFILGVESLVRQRVSRQAGRIQVLSDASRIIIHPVSDGVVLGAGVGRLDVDGDGHEVAPAFAHAAAFQSVQAVGVCGAARQPVGESVGVFVDYDAGVEGTVSVGGGVCPDVHSHASGLPIDWCCKVCLQEVSTAKAESVW
jgi:hypothetical protein